MPAPDSRKTRRFHRIRYPLSYQPKIRIRAEENESEVVELSERGVRFVYQGPSELSTGLEIHVNITFYDGESYYIEG